MNRLLIIAILCGIVGLEFAFPNAQDSAHSRIVAHNPGLQVVAQQTTQAEAADHDGVANPRSSQDNSLFTRLLAMLR
jgi:hypothetical protein